MKRTLATTLIIFFVSFLAYSQSPKKLYISKQTGEMTVLTGNITQKTKENESVSAVITTSGPIKYSVTPSELSLGSNQEKTWIGTVYPDIGKSPEAGHSAEAKLTGNYDIKYIKGQINDGITGLILKEGHPLSNNGSTTLNYVVYSIKTTLEDTVFYLCDGNFTLHATGYPAGGKYEWMTKGGAIKLIQQPDSSSIKVLANFDYKNLPQNHPQDTIIVKYSFGNVSYSANCLVKIPEELTDDMSTCKEKMLRPGYNGNVGNTTGIPDEIANQYGFTAANQAHDTCYGDCNAGKNKCDSIWLASLTHQCEGLTTAEASQCIKFAATMYSTVVNEGYAWYEAAQKESCICCKKNEEQSPNPKTNQKN